MLGVDAIKRCNNFVMLWPKLNVENYTFVLFFIFVIFNFAPFSGISVFVLPFGFGFRFIVNWHCCVFRREHLRGNVGRLRQDWNIRSMSWNRSNGSSSTFPFPAFSITTKIPARRHPFNAINLPSRDVR